MAEKLKGPGSRRPPSRGDAAAAEAVKRAHPAHWAAAAGGLHRGSVPSPPDPAQIDSWLRVNADNTVTLFHGWSELGQGSPTAVR